MSGAWTGVRGASDGEYRWRTDRASIRVTRNHAKCRPKDGSHIQARVLGRGEVFDL